MSEPASWIIHTDGAARGNPGPGAYAYVIERPGEKTIEAQGCLGLATNNVAEYSALVRALEHAHQLGGRHLVVHSDSELIVQQMNGAYKVKNPGLLPLYEQAKALTRQFENVVLRHVRRDLNKRADELCNDALDGKTSRAPGESAAPSRPKKQSPATRIAKAAAVRDQAIECLRSAATVWAHGNANQPPPDLVWDQLWDILRQEGVVA
jgi:ribonuclease HI